MATDTLNHKSEGTDISSIAAGEAENQNSGELLQLVTFVVGTEEFAIPILNVQEINRMMQITKVPKSPEFIEGVINLRGKIIPVMDLRKRFGIDAIENSAESRIVVVEVADRVVGFIVDRVNEVLRIQSDIVEPPPSMVCGLDSDIVSGVGKLDDRLLIMLNLERLLSTAELEQFEQATSDMAA